MDIVQIIPGSGGSFYCGNCLRDFKQMKTLREAGHEVTMIPMYLPLFSDEMPDNDIPIFFGAVSTYLKELYPIVRMLPKWLLKLLDSKPVLRLAARKSGSTRAKGLEDMTISMLLGEKGIHASELDKMVNWISKNLKPDIIHISNALLSGLAPKLKKHINAPIVCSLQDEDVWVDVMPENFRERIWDIMQQNNDYIDKYISVSKYYSETMQKRLNIEKSKLETIHLGIDAENYQVTNINSKQPSIGYMSRMCHENGFDILIDAFILLKQQEIHKELKLYANGGSTSDDKTYLKQIRQKLQSHNLSDQVIIYDEFNDNTKTDFYSKVQLLSVPVRNGEAFGIYLLEAMASGIPVIQPNLGAFPEIIELSEAGATYSPNTPEALASKLSETLLNKELQESMSKNAIKTTNTIFNDKTQGERLLKVYKGLV